MDQQISENRIRASTPKPVMHLRLSAKMQDGSKRKLHTSLMSRNSSTTPRAVPRTSISSSGLNMEYKRLMTAGVSTIRPLTAVRGAGYTSSVQVTDPNLNRINSSEPQNDLVDKVRLQKLRIAQILDDTSRQRDPQKALVLAREAVNKFRNVIRNQQQEQHQEEVTDPFNMNLNFYVFFTLALQYTENGLYREALNTYQLLIKSRLNQHTNNLKLNMGNVYFMQQQYQMALKMYRMALDQVSSVHKNLRLKIMHNITKVFIKMRQWQEAISSLEYIMSEQPSHQVGLQLILCARILGDDNEKIRVKTAFTALLTVPPCFITTEEKYNITHRDDNTDGEEIITLAIQNDDLFNYEIQRKEFADFCILTATKLVAASIEINIGLGYDWCIASVKNSDYIYLAPDIEINKSIMYLKRKQLNSAIKTLKTFEKISDISLNAAINLSFIYFLQGDLETATRYAERTLISKMKRPEGYVNFGACLLARNQFDEALEQFKQALECDGKHFEAIYNLGLTLKKQCVYLEALEYFQRLSGASSLSSLVPDVLYQIASLLELCNDNEAAIESYQQLLGIVPGDVRTLQKIGHLFDVEGDKQQALHYYMEGFRYYPVDLNTLNWLATYFNQMQMMEKAIMYYEKAKIQQPMNPKWAILIADCYRRSGNLHKSLTLYKRIHQQHPENVECLKALIRICSDLGMREMQEYVQLLRKIEKSRQVRERVSSSRPNSLRNSGLSVGSADILERNNNGSSNSSGSNGKGIGRSFTGHNVATKSHNKATNNNFNDTFDNDDFGDDLLPG